MKTCDKLILLLLTILIGTGVSCRSPRAGDTSAGDTRAGPERLGVYDSRLVAYACFWSEAHQRMINEMSRQAKAAKEAGQAVRYREVSSALEHEQEEIHLQVFSTAPVDDILAGMKDRLEAIQKQAGVSRFVSKWDNESLKGFSSDRQIDVTNLLLREFKLNEQQTKVVESLRNQKPLPLERARELMRKGEL